MSKITNEYSDSSLWCYKERLKVLEEQIVLLSTKAKEENLEQLEETGKEMGALDIRIQKIRLELVLAVAQIKKEKREKSWLGRLKNFILGLWRHKEEDYTSEPDYDEMPGMPDYDTLPRTIYYGTPSKTKYKKAKRKVSTGQTEMKQLKKKEKDLAEFLNTSKELSIRFCAELKAFEKMIAVKREEAEAARAQRKEEERLAAEEEKRELEEAKKHSACT